nr:polymerase [Simian T-cell lymphotropic virus 4]
MPGGPLLTGGPPGPDPVIPGDHPCSHRLRTSSRAPRGQPVSFKPERLQALIDLVSKALEAGHIEPYSGPGNNPVFPVKKPNGKWRFIHDLRATNAITTTLASPSPGPPDLTSLPQALPHLQTIDLTDAFFQIPLPKRFQPYFAFTIPQPLNHGPGSRYAWTVLPQGFKNSPTLFEQQLASVLGPARKAFPASVIVQYMDDILLACPSQHELDQLATLTAQLLSSHGLPVSQEKTQRTPGKIHFLGQIIHPDHITYETTPTIPIKAHWTLTELQTLLGELQWVSKGTPVLREHLHCLYSALRGLKDPRDTITLRHPHLHALHNIQQALHHNCRGRLDSTLPLLGLIFLSPSGTTSVLFQTNHKWPLVWLHTPHPPTSLCPWGHILACTVLTLDKYALQHYGQLCKSFHHNMSTQALHDFVKNSSHPSVAILIHHMHRFCDLGRQPPGPWRTLLQLPALLREPQLLRPAFSLSPVVIDQAPCLFSDGSPQKAAYVIWDKVILSQRSVPLPPHANNSAQKGELVGLLLGLQAAQPWPSLNIFLDSKFLIRYLQSLASGAFQGSSTHHRLQASLPTLLQGKVVYLHHTRSHTQLPDPISTLNEYTDSLIVAPVTPLKPEGLHALTHCNQQALVSHGATPAQAKQLVQACRTCQIINPQHHMPRGHIRRGHFPNHTWQGDVTHLKHKRTRYCLHVWVDTFSGAVSCVCKKKETSSDLIKTLLHAISVLGKPFSVNTDNGPAYLSQEFHEFCTTLCIKHSTHIPYNPTSSGLVERTNGILKTLLYKYFLDHPDLPLESAVSKALWTINHLNVMRPCGKTRWQLHHTPPLPPISESIQTTPTGLHWYYYKTPGLTNQRWKGPVQSLQEAAGAALLQVSDGSPQWIPWRLLKKTVCPKPDDPEPAGHVETDHQHHG